MMHQQPPAPQACMSESEIIDFRSAPVQHKAASLAAECVSELELADFLRVLFQLGTELLQFGIHKITLLIRADAQK